MSRLRRFIVAGGIGFLADAAMLALLVHALSVNPFAARLLSIGFALTITWLINRTVTFGPSGRNIAIEGARYGGVGIGTSLVNYGVYSALLAAISALPPLMALAAGSMVALLLSFLGYSRLVFDR
jgi:putative flippase GtrA